MPVMGVRINQEVAMSPLQNQGAGATGGIFGSVILLLLSFAIFGYLL